jgi:hypothetical protein
MVVVGENTVNVDPGGELETRRSGPFHLRIFGPISLLVDDWLVARLSPAKLVRLPIRYDVAGAFRSELSERRGRQYNVVSIDDVDS